MLEARMLLNALQCTEQHPDNKELFGTNVDSDEVEKPGPNQSLPSRILFWSVVEKAKEAAHGRTGKE